MIYIPIVAKLVTLGELKTSYTLKDYMQLMETTGDVITRFSDSIQGKGI